MADMSCGQSSTQKGAVGGKQWVVAAVSAASSLVVLTLEASRKALPSTRRSVAIDWTGSPEYYGIPQRLQGAPNRRVWWVRKVWELGGGGKAWVVLCVQVQYDRPLLPSTLNPKPPPPPAGAGAPEPGWSHTFDVVVPPDKGSGP